MNVAITKTLFNNAVLYEILLECSVFDYGMVNFIVNQFWMMMYLEQYSIIATIGFLE